MLIIEQNGHIKFKLQPQDFRHQWQQFLTEIKLLPDWQYNPDTKWWQLPATAILDFKKLQKKYRLVERSNKDQMVLF